MIGQISTTLGEANLNIIDMLNKCRNNIAVTLVDIDGDNDKQAVKSITQIEGVLSARCLGCGA